MKTALSSTIFLMFLVGCQAPKPYSSMPGTPESLLSTSSDRVFFGTASPSVKEEMTNWINDEQPSRAELSCTENSKACAQIKEVLTMFSVPTTAVTGTEEGVALIYSRSGVKTCANQFHSNQHNLANYNYSAFGCSLARNSANMITSHSQTK